MDSDTRGAADKLHFRGLDSLRFLAALFVVLGHIPMNQSAVGLPNDHAGVAFYRGISAVCFFFTLSGFLITYLLLEEHRRTGGIQVRSFYLRRVCRIWPLYFLIVLAGLIAYNALFPRLGIQYPVGYSPGVALLLYTLMLPNLMNSLFQVGGLLNPLWSIGVEEQFYLAWAPAVKRFVRVLPYVCAAVLAVSFAVFVINELGSAAPWLKRFIGQIKLHFMAAGALCAWCLHRHRERLLALPVFSSRIVQIVLFVLLLDFYLLYGVRWGLFLDEAVQLVLYSWIIVTVAANPRNVIPVENRAFDYLGKISYGLYMYHMFAVYLTSATFKSTTWWQGRPALYIAAYYAMALGLTALAAHLSYRWFELPFLRLKDRKWSLPAAAPRAGVEAVPAP